MFDHLRHAATDIAEYVIITALVVTGGIFAIEGWRKSPMLPLAGAFLGPVGGMFGAAVGGEAGAIAGTFLGTLGGPGAAVFFQDRDTVRRVVNHALDRWFPKKGGE